MRRQTATRAHRQDDGHWPGGSEDETDQRIGGVGGAKVGADLLQRWGSGSGGFQVFEQSGAFAGVLNLASVSNLRDLAVTKGATE